MQKQPDIFRKKNIALNGTASLTAGGTVLAISEEKEVRCSGNVAGFSGTSVQQNGIGKEIVFQREIFTAEDNSFSAIRFRIKNASRSAVPLTEALLFTGELTMSVSPEHWHVYSAGCVEETSIPACIKFGVADQTFREMYYGIDAAIPDGTAPQTLPENPLLISETLFCIDDGTQTFFSGMLEQDSAQCRMELKAQTEEASAQLSFRCRMNDVILNPGAERITPFILFGVGKNIRECAEFYAGLVAEHYRLPERKKAPRVFSSWHYFALHFNETILERQLNAIQERGIDGDVYQIDGGWPVVIGDWRANQQYPSGLRSIAAKIRSAGLRPGIWVSPFIAALESETMQKHPEWGLRKHNGEPVLFQCSKKCTALDLSRPEVLTFIRNTFADLKEQGFDYFKADFLRAAYLCADACPADRTRTTLELYRDGMKAIRDGIGDDSFLCSCGGHPGAGIGITDSQRTGGDNYSSWSSPVPFPVRFRQCMMRWWMNRWFLLDPDALMIRRRTVPLDDTPYGKIALGSFNDSEAQTAALLQTLAGGVRSIGEDLESLEEKRLNLWRNLTEAEETAYPVDLLTRPCPSVYAVKHGGWHAVINWHNREETWEKFSIPPHGCAKIND